MTEVDRGARKLRGHPYDDFVRTLDRYRDSAHYSDLAPAIRVAPDDLENAVVNSTTLPGVIGVLIPTKKSSSAKLVLLLKGFARN